MAGSSDCIMSLSRWQALIASDHAEGGRLGVRSLSWAAV